MSNGKLRVTVLNGKSMALANEQYYVQCNLPEVCKTANFNTDKQPKDQIGNWSKMLTVDLSAPLTAGMNIRLVLMEYGRIKDKPMGEGTFDCGELLAGGAHIEQRVTMNAIQGGQALCDVSLDLAWDGDVPAYAAGTGGGAMAPAGSPAGAAGVSGGATGGGGGAIIPGLPACDGRSYNIRVMLRKAKNLQADADHALYSPFVAVTINGETQKTETQKETNEPFFDEELTFTVKGEANFWSLPISIVVMNHNTILADEEIGTTQLEAQSIYRCPLHMMAHKWFILRNSQSSGQIMGFLKMTLMVLDALTDQVPELDEDPEDGEESEDSLILNLVNSPGAQFEEIYLRCEMYKAECIPQMDGVTGGGKADPYVKVAYGLKKNRTSHMSTTLTPEWNTAIMLPIQKPALIDSLMVEMYDYDGFGKDKLISVAKLSVDKMQALKGEELGKGEDGLPRQYPQFISFYGCPRGFYKDSLLPATSLSKPKYFHDMDRGLKDGVDFRGRLLCKFAGSRDKNCAAEPINKKPRTALLHFTVTLQALQFSMLKSGTYTFQVHCGPNETAGTVSSRNPKKADDMRGTKTGLTAVFFGEEVKLEHRLEVVIPEPLVAYPNDFRAFVFKQLPDIFVHLYKDKDMYAAYRVKPVDIIGKEEAVLICDTLRVLTDPEKADEGEAPSDPLGQFYVGMFVRRVEPARAEVPLTAQEIQCIPTTNEIRQKAVALGEPERYVVEACIHRGMDFPVGDPNGLSDPFVRICWANAASQTGTQLETLNPTFEELVLLRADTRQPFTNIVVELWDWDLIGSNSFLAKAVVPVRYGIEKAGEKIWLSNFTDNRGKAVSARLLVSLEVRKDVGQKYPEKIFQKKPGKNDTYTGFDIPDAKRLALGPHSISLKVNNLRKMRPFRLLDVKSAQVQVSIGNTVIDFARCKGVNPDVNQSKTLVLDLPTNPEFWPNISVAVFDNRALGSKPRIGVASIPLVKYDDKDKDKRIAQSRFDPAIKKGIKESQDKALAERLEAIKRWKLEAFGDAVAVAANTATPMNQSPDATDLAANYTFAVRQREAEAAKKKDKKKKKRGGGDGGDGAAGGDDEVEMEDSSNEMSEADIALAVMQKAREETFVSQEDKKLEAETDKTKEITKPSDIPWFERFDADETMEQKEFIVARLGKIHDYLAKKGKKFDKIDEGTAEYYFGPFADNCERVTLLRGYSKTASKAGEVNLDITLQPLSKDDPAAKLKIQDASGSLEADKKEDTKVSFEIRAYLIACRHLAAVDHSMFGSSSDPYLVLTLNSGAEGGSSDSKKLNLKEFRKDKTLNPDYYLTQQLSGSFPKHTNLLVEVYDYNDILSDKLIGFTNINLEDRWRSDRGYVKGRFAYMDPGMYTEKRQIRNEAGQVQGSIELWLDMFPSGSTIPHPIDITPPPPIEMELRTVVWATRDVQLEEPLFGEPTIDIYVRAWLNGMRNDMQSTDVHYRSLDGSGTFNWRMNFPFLFDPRSKKIMAKGKKAASVANWFRIRREQKKFDPVLKLQVYDNSILPGGDNFIGEASLNLLKMRPTMNARDKLGLFGEILGDVKEMATTFLCCSCCKKKKTFKDLTLEQRQKIAVEEFKSDCAKKEKAYLEEATERIQQIEAVQGPLDATTKAQYEKKFVAEARARGQINAFEAYLPGRKKKEVGKHLKAVMELPPMTETAKMWFTARGPKGSGRVGDVQVSFQIVRMEAMEKDEKLVAGRGRSEPQALPDPKRPESSYFWMSSPFKAAIHVLWQQFKWYILGFLLVILLALFIYLFLSEGVRVKAASFFS